MHKATRLFATNGTQARHVVLILALLPMLTYVGHWPPFEFAIPGTGASWQSPFSEGWGLGHGGGDAPAHAHGSAGLPGDEDGHAQHCHTDMGSCLHATVGAIAAAAMLMAAVAFIGRATRLVNWEAAAERQPLEWLASPLTPPPRSLSATV